VTAFDASLFFTTFTTVFVIADPAGNLPVFMSLTARMTPNERKRAAWQATLTSLVVLAVFAFFGQQILRLLGISVASMQISGGLLLLIVAMQLLSGREEDPGKPGATNVALVPLGIPLLAGPGAIAAATARHTSSDVTATGTAVSPSTVIPTMPADVSRTHTVVRA